MLQRIAQQNRAAENRLLAAEKLAAFASLAARQPWPVRTFDEAWRDLLLAQHHDCWIVPYNGGPGDTWADMVARKTDIARQMGEDAISRSLRALRGAGNVSDRQFFRVFNPVAASRDEVVELKTSGEWDAEAVSALDMRGRELPVQPIEGGLLVRVQAPPMGYATCELAPKKAAAGSGATASTQADGTVVIETDLYRAVVDPAAGGTIRSLVAKGLGDREFVDTTNGRRFNELRGNFYDAGGFHSSADQPAKVEIVERGPLRVVVEIKGTIATHPFTQRLALSQGQRRIDCRVRIDWRGDSGIGEYKETDGWGNRRRACYDDRYKLLALFPTALKNQKIWKDAPFDVCESGLKDTFFNSWENLKNNVILDWVDVAEADGKCGLALLSDHTTSYAHGPDFPLGLTLQYSGRGLWGRDYRIDGPTEVGYALVPHAGKWDEAGVWMENAAWQQPLRVSGARMPEQGDEAKSFVDPVRTGWDIPAMFFKGDDLYVRIFNAQGGAAAGALRLGFPAKEAELVELDGRVIGKLPVEAGEPGGAEVSLSIPRFGIRTLKFRDALGPR